MSLDFLTDPDLLAGYAEDVSGEIMTPEYLVRPQSTEEVSAILERCHREKIAVTPAGQQTNDTASSLAASGLCLSTERMKKVLEVNPQDGFAIAEPGILLGDFKQTLEENGGWYPPDPSSENIASLGGTVATNASGARSYRYGATANHVLGLEVVLPGGEVQWVSRNRVGKTTTGPKATSDLADFWIGSEGILGVVTKVKVQLQSPVPEVFALVVYFKQLDTLIQLACDLRNGLYPAVSPRSLEFMDSSCLELFRSASDYSIPKEAAAAVILEQEYHEDPSNLLADWLEALNRAGALESETLVADSPSKIVELREMRHFLPSTLNEHGTEAREYGGRKVSTDWAVPLPRFQEMISRAEELGTAHGFPPERTYRFAHLGDGHPHYNFIPQNSEELQRCLELRRQLSKLAVSLGGTVAGEHGIGKLRKDLFAFEDRALKLRILRAIKQELDPRGIMAPGNLL